MLNQGCYQQSVVIKNENIIDTAKKIMQQKLNQKKICSDVSSLRLFGVVGEVRMLLILKISL